MNSPAVSYDRGEFIAIGSSSELGILGFDGAGGLQPERRLMFAILLDAVECFQKNAGDETNRLFKDTEEWIFEDDHKWPFSFFNICEAVDIDPKYLRKGLLQWEKEQSRKPLVAGRRSSTASFPSKNISRKFQKSEQRIIRC